MRSRRFGVWGWVAGVAALLCASAAWIVPVSTDGLATLRTSFSLLLTGWFRLPAAPPGAWADPYMFRTPPGGVGLDYGYPPLGSLVRAALLAPVGLVPAGVPRGRAADVVLTLLPVLLTALSVVPLARLARFAGCSRRAAPALAAALLSATFIGPLGRQDFQEPFVVFLSVSALERVLVARRREGAHRRWALAACGGLVGLALLAKPTVFVLVPPLLFAMARPLRRPARARDFAAFAAGMAPGLAAFLVLNDLRFGSPLDFGYRWGDLPSGGLRLPLAWTALRLTVLPNRGVFWFAPLLLLALFVPMRSRFKEPLRTDCAAALLAAGGFFAANLWWWVWEGGFGWGPRLLAPAVALSIPWLAGSGRAWRRAAFALTLFGFALNLPAYLLDEGRLYTVVGSRPKAIPFGPAMPRHIVTGTGLIHPFQRLHYLPGEASWIEGPKVLYSLLSHGEGKDAGSTREERRDSMLLRILLGKPVWQPFPGTGRFLLDDSDVASSVDADRALIYARTAVDFGGPPVDSRALLSMLLLRKGRAAEAAEVCREALALDPSRADVRTNLAVAQEMLQSRPSR